MCGGRREGFEKPSRQRPGVINYGVDVWEISGRWNRNAGEEKNVLTQPHDDEGAKTAQVLLMCLEEEVRDAFPWIWPAESLDDISASPSLRHLQWPHQHLLLSLILTRICTLVLPKVWSTSQTDPDMISCSPRIPAEISATSCPRSCQSQRRLWLNIENVLFNSLASLRSVQLHDLSYMIAVYVHGICETITQITW